MSIPPLSVQLYSLREQMKDGQHLAVLKGLAAAGYAGVETAGNLYGMSAADFRAAVEDLGMVVSGCHMGMPKPEEFTDGSHQGLPSPADYARTAAVQHALGSDRAIIASTPREEWATADGIKRLGERIEHARAAFAKEGITLYYHNHEFEIVRHGGRIGLEILCQQVPGLWLELDTYWAANLGAEVPAAVVRALRARLRLLHLKDGTFQRSDRKTACGAGRQDFAAIMAAADLAQVAWGVVELDDCDTDMRQAVADSAKYLIGKGFVGGRTASAKA